MEGLKRLSDLPGVEEMAANMAADVAQNAHKQKIHKPSKGSYKEESDAHKGRQLAGRIHAGNDTLKTATTRPKINLNDTEAVRQRVFEYLEAAELAQVYPSVMGMSVSFGHSRQYGRRTNTSVQ